GEEPDDLVLDLDGTQQLDLGERPERGALRRRGEAVALQLVDRVVLDDGPRRLAEVLDAGNVHLPSPRPRSHSYVRATRGSVCRGPGRDKLPNAAAAHHCGARQSAARSRNSFGGGSGDQFSPGKRRKPDAAHVPPSTCIVVPVTAEARSDARNSTASPRSST